MKKLTQFNLIALLCIFLLNACSLSGVKTKTPYNVLVSFDDREELAFEGKGAGAGMMLMSSMGAMGVAVGVAIDEGIAKDIQMALNAENAQIESLIVEVLSQAYPGKQITLVEKANADEGVQADLNISINRYGFKSIAGDNDPSHAWLSLSLKGKEQSKSYQYPKQFFTEDNVPTEPLEVIKINGVAAKKLLSNALVTTVNAWRADTGN